MAAIRMSAVTVWRWVAAEQRRAVLLRDVDWTVEPGEHWVVLGPNGAGKTTLLNLAAAISHPSEGAVEVLGERLGAVDMRRLRESIGTLEPGLSRRIRGRYTGFEVVLTGATGSIALLGDRVTAEDRARADRLMAEIGVEPLRDRRFEDCSQGERQRLLLARSLMDDPDLLLLDEPTTGLDLPSRERLIASLDAMAEDQRRPADRHRHPPPGGDPLDHDPRPPPPRRRPGGGGPGRLDPHQRQRLHHLRHRGRGRPPRRPLGRHGPPQPVSRVRSLAGPHERSRERAAGAGIL